MKQFVVCALYKFVRLDNYMELQEPLLQMMIQHQVFGTLLLAGEGINGTIAGPESGIEAVLEWLGSEPALAELQSKRSYTDNLPFKRSKVKLKKEIVTMGVEGIDPARSAGTYVEPEQWNELISDPDVVLIDTRNDYECQVGSFRGAVNPNTETFREFPAYAEGNLEAYRNRKIAMYCTGGIRCEKSTAYLREKGYENVYHLKGGILNYLEKISPQDSLWQGECFVFDDRVTVDHDLQPGNYDQCHACRRPISNADIADPRYQQGVSCPHCFDEKTAEQKGRFAEREKQMRLAQKRGEAHLGDAARQGLIDRRRNKRSGKSGDNVQQ